MTDRFRMISVESSVYSELTNLLNQQVLPGETVVHVSTASNMPEDDRPFSERLAETKYWWMVWLDAGPSEPPPWRG